MATSAATRSATSPAAFRCRVPHLRRARPGARRDRQRRSVPSRTRWARSAGWRKRRPGKDSVTGHWELMGLVLDRPFPVFPEWIPARADRRVRAAHRPRHARRTRPRAARRSSTNSARSTCAPASRSSTRRPTACSRSPRTKTSCRSPELYRWCEIAFELAGIGLGVGRVIARPFVGAPGAFRRTANRRDFALTPFAPTLLDRVKDAGPAGDRDREDRGSVRRPRDHGRRPYRRATSRAWTKCCGRWRRRRAG